jgi:precorrin-6x reductase
VRRTCGLLMVALVGVCGYVRLRRPLEERELVVGASVASLVASYDTAVVLLYEPSDVFVCYGSLQPWLDWRRRHPGSVTLVFTRPATDAERKQLATYRVHPDATLRPRIVDRLRPTESPAELLLAKGRVIATARVESRKLESPLFRRVRAGLVHLDPSGGDSPPR